jgi:hypothetical protein
MFRGVWVALACLVCVGALFALKTSVGAPVKKDASPFDTTVGTSADQEPLAKADRLDAAIEELPEKNVVSTTKIEPPKSGVGPSEKATEITSWHWHAGGKIAKRSASGIHYYDYASRAKSRNTKN